MKNKDVGMGLDDFLSLGGHLLVPFLFHEVTSLHPPSFQRNDFSTCYNYKCKNPSLHLCFKKWFALFGIGSERQDLLQNNCMLLVQEQRNKK